MPTGADRPGLRALAVLAVAGLVGVGLAIHGYGRGGVLAGPHGGLAPVTGSHARSSTPSHASNPPASTTPQQSPTPQHTSTTTQHKLGPLLSSTPYAPYAFRVYPGPEGPQTRQATAGFTIRVRPAGGTIDVSVSASGSGQPGRTSTFPASDRVYFIEASLGDDSGNVEYNFGDDGLIVTDAQGHVVQ